MPTLRHTAPMGLDLEAIDIDCNDPERVGRFWAEVFGAELSGPEDDMWWLTAAGSRPELLFCRVPEGKAVKNRVHLDLRPTDQDAEVRRLESLGARRVDIGQGDVTWVVMADVEGNEFCVLRARPAAGA